MENESSWKLQDRKTEDSLAHIYDFLYHRTHFARRAMYGNFSKLVCRHAKSGRILELGCGTGRLSGLISKNACLDRYCMDLSYNMLLQAKTRCPQCLQADMEHLPYRDGSFDTIFVHSALHHFPHLHEVVPEFKRILKPAGYLLIQEGNTHNIRLTKLLAMAHQGLRQLGVKQFPDVSKREIQPSDHHAPLPMEKIIVSLQDNGFTIVDKKYIYYTSYLFSIFDNELVYWLSRIPDRYYVNKMHDGYLSQVIAQTP
jgi:ubiquinone/menaquinone biosynthesis C-methylase UbiE